MDWVIYCYIMTELRLALLELCCAQESCVLFEWSKSFADRINQSTQQVCSNASSARSLLHSPVLLQNSERTKRNFHLMDALLPFLPGSRFSRSINFHNLRSTSVELE